MSFLFGSDAPATKNTTGEQYLQGPSQAVAGQLQNIVGQPYQPYAGPRTAGFSDDQEAAMQATRDQQGIAGLNYNEAMDMTRGAAGSVQPGEIQNYMNPYMQNVADTTAAEMQRRYEISRQGMRTDATMAGAWGQGRHGIMEAEGERNLNQGIANMYADQYSNAWKTGLGAAQADRSRQMGGGLQLGNQARQGQEGAYKDISSLGRVGEAQQGQVQQNYDLAYGDFERQRDYPKEQLGYMTDVISRLRTPQAGTTTETAQKSGALGSIAGLGIAGLSAYYGGGWG